MRQEKPMILCLFFLLLLVFGATAALADVAPGDVIDKSNWEKARGLAPENVLDWLKKGDLVMEVAELNYDPKNFVPQVVKKSMEANKGKYDVDEGGLIVESATGKAPEFIEGIPFPGVDPNDPKAGTKLIYNKYYHSHSLSHGKYTGSLAWVGRNTGYEREVATEYRQFVMDGAPAARDVENPDGKERMALVLALAPFDIKGTNLLTWRYRDARQDSTFAYMPAIRRVRRMSPSNRSDGYLGSEYCVDDAWGFDGKVNSMDWKIVGKQEALMPFLSPDPQSFVITETGAWSSFPAKRTLYGHEVDGWQGAPWMPTNIVWVKRQVYVVRITPKDPYYNYGPHELWMDAEAQMMMAWKVINDRAGKYWKTFWQGNAGFQGPEEHQKAMLITTQLAVDDRREHGVSLWATSKEYPAIFNDAYDVRDFSLAGFARFCK